MLEKKILFKILDIVIFSSGEFTFIKKLMKMIIADCSQQLIYIQRNVIFEKSFSTYENWRCQNHTNSKKLHELFLRPDVYVTVHEKQNKSHQLLFWNSRFY